MPRELSTCPRQTIPAGTFHPAACLSFRRASWNLHTNGYMPSLRVAEKRPFVLLAIQREACPTNDRKVRAVTRETAIADCKTAIHEWLGLTSQAKLTLT
jgi:hypothetical protein